MVVSFEDVAFEIGFNGLGGTNFFLNFELDEIEDDVDRILFFLIFFLFFFEFCGCVDAIVLSMFDEKFQKREFQIFKISKYLCARIVSVRCGEIWGDMGRYGEM